jgi:hypothetical protein
MLRKYILNNNFTGGINPDIIPMCTYLQQFKENSDDNRGFSLNLADLFFIKRLKKINLTFIIPDLEQWTNNIKISNNPIKTFNLHMNIIRDKVFRINNNNEILIDWDNLPKNSNAIDTLYSLRECIITLSLLTVSKIFELSKDGDIINIGTSPSRVLKKTNANAIIMGSLTLFSDIDISIQSKNASGYIAVIEDLWQMHKDWFNNELWKVDLYGDFTQIGNYYMDTHYFNKSIIIEMLILAVCSFLKVNDMVNTDTKLLQKLVEWCIDSQGLYTTYNKIMNYAENKIRTIDKTNRELYYNKLADAEKFQINIINKFKKCEMSEELNDLLGECIIKLGDANLYKEENYILSSTVIYIVKIEQGQELTKNRCNPLYTTVANCSLGLYTYILSAIEQLGYMLHKKYQSKLSCSLPQGKYFGRFIRSIGHANNSMGILSTMTKNSKYTKTFDVIDEIDRLKKTRSSEKNDDITCPFDYDLYYHALELFEYD